MCKNKFRGLKNRLAEAKKRYPAFKELLECLDLEKGVPAESAEGEKIKQFLDDNFSIFVERDEINNVIFRDEEFLLLKQPHYFLYKGMYGVGLSLKRAKSRWQCCVKRFFLKDFLFEINEDCNSSRSRSIAHRRGLMGAIYSALCEKN